MRRTVRRCQPPMRASVRDGARLGDNGAGTRPERTMLHSLAKLPRVVFAAVLIALSTVMHCLVLFVLAFVKLAVPPAAVRRACNRALVAVAESWIGINSFLIDVLTPTRFEFEGLDGLRHDGHYLVLCNHQSWVDIPVLQKAFNRRAPFLRFFLKQQLIWVPLLGLAWWALDFPFMRRYTKSQLARKPELAGKDIEATRRACARFRDLPVSVMNFVEGTRFTPAKHARQQSPYRFLLKPKAGGVAFVLDAMGGALHAILDVSIVYDGPVPSMLDLMAGRIRAVRVRIRQRPIPAEMLDGDYERDRAYRARFQQWLNQLWLDKDADLAELRAGLG